MYSNVELTKNSMHRQLVMTSMSVWSVNAMQRQPIVRTLKVDFIAHADLDSHQA